MRLLIYNIQVHTHEVLLFHVLCIHIHLDKSHNYPRYFHVKMYLVNNLKSLRNPSFLWKNLKAKVKVLEILKGRNIQLDTDQNQ